MLSFISIANIIIISIIGLNLLIIYMKYKSYKGLYRKHYKSLFNKYINQKYRLILPIEKSDKYKKIKRNLVDCGWEISVHKFILLKVLLMIVGCILLINVNLTNKNLELKEIIENVNYGKLSTEIKKAKDFNASEVEKRLYNSIKSEIGTINNDNLNSRISVVKRYIESTKDSINESSEIIARRLIQKVIDTREIEESIDDFIYIIIFSVLLYFTPDIICLIRKYLIEDKKHWETVISIFTYCIFAQIPPCKTTMIVDNLVEVTDIYKKTFEKINYGLKNGKGEVVIDEVIKSIGAEEEMLELLETLKLTISSGVEKTVENMELLAQNAIEWQKIKQTSRRNKKYLILIPLMLLIFMLCFDYVMYGLTEIITTFKLEI